MCGSLRSRLAWPGAGGGRPCQLKARRSVTGPGFPDPFTPEPFLQGLPQDPTELGFQEPLPETISPSHLPLGAQSCGARGVQWLHGAEPPSQLRGREPFNRQGQISPHPCPESLTRSLPAVTPPRCCLPTRPLPAGPPQLPTAPGQKCTTVPGPKPASQRLIPCPNSAPRVKATPPPPTPPSPQGPSGCPASARGISQPAPHLGAGALAQPRSLPALCPLGSEALSTPGWKWLPRGSPGRFPLQTHHCA